MIVSSAPRPSLPPAYRLIAHDRLASTNETARELAREGVEDGTLVWAREQTAGRGRRGRSWSSPPGNLYLSLVLRPDCPPGIAAQLGFVAALAIGETCGALVPPLVDLHMKWPNDVLLGGRKVSGILIESQMSPSPADTSASSLDWLVLGVGINVAHFPGDASFPATSLLAEGAEGATVELALEGFARHFMSWTNRWLDDGFAPVRAAWLRRAYRLGEQISVRQEGASLIGRFVDLDLDGALVLETSDGPRRIAAGDVFPVGE